MRADEQIVGWELCKATRNLTCLSHRCRHGWNAPPTASLAPIRYLASVNTQQASLNNNSCNFVRMEELSEHLCFVRTSMLDAILGDWPSSAICRTATELTNYWREFSTSTAKPPASASDVVGQNKLRVFSPPAYYTDRATAACQRS
jgi:hypothetical protein